MTVLYIILFLGAIFLLSGFLFQYLVLLSTFSRFTQIIILLFLSLSLISFTFCISIFIGVQFHILMIVASLGLILLTRLSKRSVHLPFSYFIPKPQITGQQVLVSALVLLFTRNFFLKSERWGTWDAWSIWNLHAKFLSFDHNWQRMLSDKISWTHSDYPLFLSSIIAFVWKSTGAFEPYTPIILAYLIALAIPLLLYSTAPSAYRAVLGIAFLIILLTDFNFLSLAVSQGADTLLSVFYLLSLICFYHRTDQRISFLAGFFGATCGWIKNEGLLFYLVLLLFFAGSNYRNRKLIAYFVAGSLLPLSIILFYKLNYAPTNDLVQGQSAETIKYLFTPSRYVYIGKYIINTIFLKFPLVLPGLFISAYVGFQKKETVLLAILLLVLVGYFFVYVTTPHDLYWHLSTSCERLIHQLYPSLLFTMGNVIASRNLSVPGFISHHFQQPDVKA